MLLWIRRNPLLSSLLIAAAAFFGFGGVDLIFVGVPGLLTVALLSAGLGFVRFNSWVAMASIALATIYQIGLDVRPGLSGVIALSIVGLIAMLHRRLDSLVALAIGLIAGIANVANLIFVSGLASFGLDQVNSTIQFNAAVLGFVLVISGTTLAYSVGWLLQTRATHVGTNFDRVVAASKQAQQKLLLAEQDARFKIASDISELLVQRLTATVSLSDGAGFALKGESEIAERAIKQISASARAAHLELRRLYDMLGRVDRANAAPPGIDELTDLLPLFRELGYNISLTHLGTRKPLDEGMELAIYRIVFEALENVKQHVPAGADVTIDFSWTDQGLQVLIKDNGVEVLARNQALSEGYTVEDDQRALTEAISGAGITAMRERAAIYRGSIDANRVPGVGFTVSAIFPGFGQ